MRFIYLGLLLLLVAPALAAAQEPEPVGKALELGHLADSFTLVSATRSFDGTEWRFALKLQAKKDVDTGDVYCQAGFFDKTKHLIYASPVKFSAQIPLKMGESIDAFFTFPSFVGDEGVPWRMIAIRAAKKTT
jgi:hypothetical protein